MKSCRWLWVLLVLSVGLAGALGAAAATVCAARSGAQRAVLLELYTSEGCDSCPPADRRLSQFKSQADHVGRLVPLAFHVDYWDRLGWVDRFASPRHTERQQTLASRARSRLVYTPQFVRNGRDWRGAGSPLDGVASGPAADLTLELELRRGGLLAAAGEVRVAAPQSAAEVYLALYENNLESSVRAGENAGKVLRHDYVVRRLIGPLALDKAGRLAWRQEIALDAAWKRADLGLVVFVQNPDGEILQALQRHACAS